MLWALIDDIKVEPSPNMHGKCPMCEGNVLSKCGDIKVWHWAHFKGESCDSWYEPESYWHRNWKLNFGKENSEIIVKKEGKWHIADILTDEKVVIELQNSPIQKKVVRKREDFYGEKMLWLINGIKFKHNFYIKDWDDLSIWWNRDHASYTNIKGQKEFRWYYPRRSWEDAQRPIFIDFHEETLLWVKSGMGSGFGEGQLVSKKNFIEKYGGDYKHYLKLLTNRTVKFFNHKVHVYKGQQFVTSYIMHKGKRRNIGIFFKSELDEKTLNQFQSIVVNGDLIEQEGKNALILNNSTLLGGKK